MQDPEHMSLAPRLMDRPALEVRTSSGGDDDKGEDPDLMRASFDKVRAGHAAAFYFPPSTLPCAPTGIIRRLSAPC